ncbi:MAG TPA: glycosyltransferase family 4 protein [Blastocatellia bacterium]|nr:glycosyltransferase family 4 protein [Blastocatellia bacterium]
MRLVQVNDHGVMVGGVESYMADLSDLLESAGIEVIQVYGIASPHESPSGGESRPQRLLGDCCPLTRRRVFCPDLLRPHLGVRERHRLRQLVEALSPDAILVHHIESPDVLEFFCTVRPTVQFVHVPSRFVCPGRGKFYAKGHVPCHRPFGPYCLIAPFRHGCGSRRPWTILSNSWLTRRWISATQHLRRILVASEYMKRELEAVGIPAEKIVVNPLFFSSDRAEDEARRPSDGAAVPLFRSDAVPIVLFCGRMYDYKGADYLLDALAHVKALVRAIFIGDGPERARLQRKSKELGLHHNVDFPGWLDRREVKQLYRWARVLVMPSLWPEPFGRVGIEAMAEGAPVVAFGVGAIPEWLADGEVGFLVEPRNVRQLAEKIERLVTDDDLFQRMSARARSLVAERFSPEGHLHRLLDVMISAQR